MRSMIFCFIALQMQILTIAVITNPARRLASFMSTTLNNHLEMTKCNKVKCTRQDILFAYIKINCYLCTHFVAEM